MSLIYEVPYAPEILGVFIIILSILYLLAGAKKFDTAGYYLVFFTGLMFPVLPVLFGKDSGMQFFLFVMIIFPFFYFPGEDKKSVIISVIPAVLFVFFIEAWFLRISPVLSADKNLLNIFYYVSLGSVCLLLVNLAYFSFSASKKIEKEIQSLLTEGSSFKNKEIKNSVDEKPVYEYHKRAALLVLSLKENIQDKALKEMKTLKKNLEQFAGFFDSLCKKYEIKKIYSAGGKYLFLSLFESGSEKQMINCVLMSLEIQYFMKAVQSQKTERNEIFFDFCIGIHSEDCLVRFDKTKDDILDIYGPVLKPAALAGKEGKAGQVNLTQESYELVKEFFICKKYKKIKTKTGKEEYTISIVESIRPELTENNEGIVPNEKFYDLYKSQA